MSNDNENDIFLQKLGERITYFRKLRGYTDYEKFAYDHDFSRSMYGEWERGRNMEALSLKKVMRAFQVSPEEFFKGFDQIY